MSFNPILPADHSPVVAAELRNQFNGLKAIIDDLQNQLAPLVPVISRSVAGEWTVTFAGPPPVYWQIWTRFSGNEAWFNFGELPASAFPAPDSDVIPDGVDWWQIKMIGQGDGGLQTTAFSNIISYGPVP
jgi:hypothetical protein